MDKAASDENSSLQGDFVYCQATVQEHLEQFPAPGLSGTAEGGFSYSQNCPSSGSADHYSGSLDGVVVRLSTVVRKYGKVNVFLFCIHDYHVPVCLVAFL